MIGYIILLIAAIISLSYLLYSVIAHGIYKDRKEKIEASIIQLEQEGGNLNSIDKERDRLAFIKKNTSFINVRVGVYAAIIFTILWIIFGVLLKKISGQEVGVVVTPKGVSENVITSGWNFISPLNDVYEMDKTTQVYTFANSNKEGAKGDADAIWVPTSDGIKMGFDLSVSWQIEEKFAWWIFSHVSEQDGDRYNWIEENKIRALTKSAAALTVSNYSPIEAYGAKREEIQQNIEKRLREDLKSYHLILTSVDIREVYYNAAYENAINQKKLAEQEVLKLTEVTKQEAEKLIQAKIKKDIAIQEAMGKAEALRIEGQSISSNPKIIQLEWIKAWREGGSQVPKIITGNGGSNFLMNLGDLDK